MDREYGIHIGDEFLARDWHGKLVVLREETMFKTNEHGRVVDVYTTEILVDPEPSEEKIFLLKLKDGDTVRDGKLAVLPRLEDS